MTAEWHVVRYRVEPLRDDGSSEQAIEHFRQCSPWTSSPWAVRTELEAKP